ncbi:MAG: hypothetical protein JO211_07275 [Acidobacteriaceae bacterium]|nr:hypothetical protein [Acidobacteriaceae bacterium]
MVKVAVIRRIAISAFLLFHILAITCWSVPLSTPLIAAMRNVIRPYLVWSGLFQSWDTFAPSPKSINSYVDAIVIYKDGRTETWKFPRMEQLSLTERYSEERYRKFVENLKEDTNAGLWPDVARHIARAHNDASNPPQTVMLIRHWSDIVPRTDAAHESERWHIQIFYEYNVKPEDLT